MASIKGCRHLIKRKNQELLNNYRIVFTNFVSCQSASSKLAKKKLAKCQKCKLGGPQLLSCLYCVCFVCPTHFEEHFKSTQHSLGINLTFGHTFCSHCDDYTYDSDFLSISNSLNKDGYSFGTKLLALNHVSSLPTPHTTIIYVKDIPVPGFANLGNTCFLNSVIQVLMHTPMLRNYFLSDQHICQFVNNPGQCIICEMSKIYQITYALKVKVISLQYLLKIFWENTLHMISALQQDAHECFIAILDIMHKHSIIQNENDKDIKHLEKCQCIIHKVFKGVMQSDIVCQSCNNVSSKIDIFNDIPIYFSMDEKGKYPTNITLMACIEQFGKIEVLNDLDCTNCQTKKLSTKQLSLKHLPIVMCFILKRFGQKLDKITTIVEFPETLNMSKFMEKTTSTGSAFIDQCVEAYRAEYRLYAVICHEGLLNGGHYLAYVRNMGYWCQCNDNVVRKVPIEDVLKSPAYILLYHKEFMNYSS